MDLLRELTSLPHRGAGTAEELRAAEMLQAHLRAMGAESSLRPFSTPRTYITEVWWLLSALIAGLLLVPVLRYLALLWLVAVVCTALAYFDWRETIVSRLPPRVTAHNVVATAPPGGNPKHRLILMAHYDSAPVSRLYLPSMVKGFHQSLLMSLGLMVATLLVVSSELLGWGLPYVAYLRWGLILYFLAQGFLSTVDYLRHGFTNGAADNASGTAVAVAVAQRLWRHSLPEWTVELVLTSAEEANLKGSLAYFKTSGPFDCENTYVLNFDNVGAGQLKIITRTGSLTDVVYDNSLVNTALNVAETDSRFVDVRPGVWRTGDFDSLWFARAGIPSLTISAQDIDGQIAHLHRPSDTVENVDPAVVRLAVDLGEAIAHRLAQLRAGGADSDPGGRGI